MLRVLIVDDEPDICELIHKLIDWEEMDMVSLGSVQNGIAAMEIILRQKPDIVITDIQMPGMTGLELIEKVTLQKLQTKFIVISGYREFEYAQQAIRFGVEDYLLKPISKKDLNLVLHRISQECGAAMEKQASETAILDELRQKNVILRKNELRQTLTDPHRAFHGELFSFHPGIFLAVCVHASYRNKAELHRSSAQKILENISLRIREEFKNTVFDMEHIANDCNSYILLNYASDCPVSYTDRRNTLQRLLHEATTQYQNLRVTFAMGTPVNTVDEIRDAIATAEEGDVLRLYAGTDKVIEQMKLRAGLPDTPECKISTEDIQKLLQLVETMQKDAALKLIRSIYSEFRGVESYSISGLFAATRNTMLRIRSDIVENGLRENLDGEEAQQAGIFTEKAIHRQLTNCDTVDDLADVFCEYVASEIDYCQNIQSQRLGMPIQIAQEYVRVHIDRQISLEEVSEQAFVSAGYLSTLFKERTGKNFSDYVVETRIDEAKRLLRQPEMSIGEVAQRVGYADARHFSKVFQKVVGVKPTAYRKFYL